jgi:tRNA(adenine34) deaminase
MDPSATEALDRKIMGRCIELAKLAATYGEFPYASVIAKNGEIVAEATNRVSRDKDVTRHAELIALSEAQKTLGSKTLRNCTLYTTVEPCPMCSFPIRETRIGRVVYSIRSPLMGGFSKWNVLGDAEISNVMPEAFGEPVEVVGGVLLREAQQVWRHSNPIVWAVIKHRGCFAEPAEEGPWLVNSAPKTGFFRNLLNRTFFALHK